MKINISTAQYRNLITMSGIANGVFGILGDSLPNTDYKKRSDTMEALEEYLLSFAHEFKCNDLVQDYRGKKIFDDEQYEKVILPIIEDYDEYNLFDGLANKLAWRDFRNDHSKAEIQKMSEEHGGYLGVRLYDYEKKYWDEFEKYEYDRLVIQKEMVTLDAEIKSSILSIKKTI